MAIFEIIANCYLNVCFGIFGFGCMGIFQYFCSLCRWAVANLLLRSATSEIASCAVSLLNDIWVRVEHSLLQKLKLVAVQTVYRQDVNEMWRRVEHLPQKNAWNILAMKKIRKIFVFLKFHFHNDGRPRPKNYFEMFFWAHINLLVCKISSWSDMPNRFFAN